MPVNERPEVDSSAVVPFVLDEEIYQAQEEILYNFKRLSPNLRKALLDQLKSQDDLLNEPK